MTRDNVVRWAPPALDAIAEPSPLDALIIETITAEPPPPPLQLPTPEEIQAIREAARQEGFEQGTAQIEGILDNFGRPLVKLEGEVVAALGELAVRIAGHLVGRAYEAEPALLRDLVGEALDAVGGSSRDVEVRLHPDDIAALAPLLSLEPGQRLSPDPGLSRGDLRVHAESVRIDGTLDARLRAALSVFAPLPPAAMLLGGLVWYFL